MPSLHIVALWLICFFPHSFTQAWVNSTTRATDLAATLGELTDPITCNHCTCRFTDTDCIWEEVDGDSDEPPGEPGEDDQEHEQEGILVPPPNDPDTVGAARVFHIKDPLGGNIGVTVSTRPYPGSGSLFSNSVSRPLSGSAFKMEKQACKDTEIKAYPESQFSKTDKSKNWATEHVIELQYMAAFVQYLFDGILPGGQTVSAPYTAVTLQNNWNKNCLSRDVTVPGSSFKSRVPNDLVVECLGSSTRTRSLLLLERSLNSRKSKCFSRLASKPAPIDKTKFKKWVRDAITDTRKTDGPLQAIREVIGIWAYLQHDDVVAAIDDIQDCLSATFRTIETSCLAFAPSSSGRRPGIRQHWIDFDKAYWTASTEHCKNSVKEYMAQLEELYEEAENQGVPGISGIFPVVRDTVDDLQLDMDELMVRPNDPPT